jgi:hypothetical protein
VTQENPAPAKAKQKGRGRGRKAAREAASLDATTIASAGVPPPADLPPRRSLMDALRNAFEPTAPPPQAAPEPPAPKKKRRQRAPAPSPASISPLPPTAVDGASPPAQDLSPSGQEMPDNMSETASAASAARKTEPRGRAKKARIFTPLEVEEAEVIIVRRR